MTQLRHLASATLLVPFRGGTPPPWLLGMLDQGLGGVLLFGHNVGDPEQVARLSATLGSAGDRPLVAIDEEGGDVTRLAHRTGSPYPGNAALGAVDEVPLTRRVHRAMGAELAALGINADLAPSVDVNTADDNPIIGTRAFGADPELVSRHAPAAVAGLQDAGVAACAKHFPGHGATRRDSHLELPTVDADLNVLDHRDLAPFRAAISAGVQMVMTAHVRVPAITGRAPATLSPAAIGGLLRGRLAFEGVVISDALEMRAVADSVDDLGGAAVRALNAGVDLLCLGARQTADEVSAVIATICDAVRTGELAYERLADAADRVWRLRAWTEDAPRVGPDDLAGIVAARRAVRLHGDPGELYEPFVVELQAPPNVSVGNVPWGLAPWLIGTDDAAVRVADPAAEASALLARADGRSLVVVVRDAHRYRWQRELLSALLSVRPDAVVVEMGLPVWHPPSAAYLATYGASQANARAAAEVLGCAPRPGRPDRPGSQR